MPTIKVRRAGIFKSDKKNPFAEFLSEQQRSALTFSPNISRREEKGWTTEEFCLEARHRGLEVLVNTACTWRRGTHPGHTIFQELSKRFKGIKF